MKKLGFVSSLNSVQRPGSSATTATVKSNRLLLENALLGNTGKERIWLVGNYLLSWPSRSNNIP